MKKKGLIISTVVMVVVLIASLTTATYAWFTAASTVQVNDISLSVKSSAQVNVGVKFGEGKTYNDYYYNSVTVPTDKGTGGNANTVVWTGTDTGLGATLTFEDLVLGGSKAVGTSDFSEGWNSTDKQVDATTNVLGNNKYIIVADGKKGEGNNNNQVNYEGDSVALAEANKDYLNATIGIEANKEGIKGMFAKVEVLTTDSKVTLGVNAAIHFVIKVGDKKINVEPFASLKNSSVKSTATLNSATSAPIITRDGTGATAQLKSTFYFWIAEKEDDTTFKTGGQEINDFQIYAYIDGTDPDCVLDAEGSCIIRISFDGTNDLTKLGNDTSAAAVSSVCFLTLA